MPSEMSKYVRAKDRIGQYAVKSEKKNFDKADKSLYGQRSEKVQEIR